MLQFYFWYAAIYEKAKSIPCTLLYYESYGMQISVAFGSHFRVWRHRSS